MLVAETNSIATLARMANSEKKPIDVSAAEEGARLKALYDRHKGELTQHAFAGKLEVTQGLLSQYFSGARPISLKVATKFARELKVPFEDVSPALAKDVLDAWTLIGQRISSAKNNSEAAENTDNPDRPIRVQNDIPKVAQRFFEDLSAAVHEKRAPAELVNIFELLLKMTTATGRRSNLHQSKTVKRHGSRDQGEKTG